MLVALIVVGALFLVGFFVHVRAEERAGEEPLLSTGAVQEPRRRTSASSRRTSSGCCSWAPRFVVSAYLQVVRGYNAIQTGVIFTAATGGILVSSLAAERLAKKYSAAHADPRRVRRHARRHRRPAGAGERLAQRLGVRPRAPAHRPRASGTMLTPSVNIVQSSFPEERQGEISGLSRCVSNLGSSLGTAIAGTILVSGLTSGAYGFAMLTLAGARSHRVVARVMLPEEPCPVDGRCPRLTDRSCHPVRVTTAAATGHTVDTEWGRNPKSVEAGARGTRRSRSGSRRPSRPPRTRRTTPASGSRRRGRDHPSVDIAFTTFERDFERGGGLIAGALAYRFFFWLLPFVLVLVGGLGFLSASSDDRAARSREASRRSRAHREIHRGRIRERRADALLRAADRAARALLRQHRVREGVDGGALARLGRAATRSCPEAAGRRGDDRRARRRAGAARRIEQHVRRELQWVPASRDRCCSSSSRWRRCGSSSPGSCRTPRRDGLAPRTRRLLVAAGIQGVHVVTVYYVSRKVTHSSSTYGALGRGDRDPARRCFSSPASSCSACRSTQRCGDGDQLRRAAAVRTRPSPSRSSGSRLRPADLRHDLVRVAARAQQLGHALERGPGVAEEVLEARAEIVQARLAVRRRRGTGPSGSRRGRRTARRTRGSSGEGCRACAARTRAASAIATSSTIVSVWMLPSR